MKRLPWLGVLLIGAWACSSGDDDVSPSGDPEGSGGSGGTTTQADASSSGLMSEAAPPADHSTTTDKDTGAVADARANASDAPKIVDAEQVDAPMACVKYCTCMAKWCADKVFGTGCLAECTRQTNWDLPCRQNMCNLVEPQPNNDHCTHAFGMFQCTDN